MDESYYFYDKHVSLYCHTVCFLAKMSSVETVLVFVNVRDENG